MSTCQLCGAAENEPCGRVVCNRFVSTCPPITWKMVSDEPDGLIHEYAFDITLIGAVRVRACDEATALAALRLHLDGADANLGAWTGGPDAGKPILAEVSLVTTDADPGVGPPSLYEIDGEPCDT